MSLTILYTDPILKENKELFIKVCLNTDYNSENTITEHPSETKISFIDNSLQKLKEVPATIFIPAEEEYETKVIKNDVTKKIKSTVTKTETRTKENVLEILEMLKNKAIFLNLDINGRTYIKYVLKSISFSESIDSGDGWDIKLAFTEARIANSKKTVLSKEMIEALKKALAESIANENSTASVMAKIVGMNKVAVPSNKGSQKPEKNKTVEDFNNSYVNYNGAEPILVPTKNGKANWGANVTDRQKNIVVDMLSKQGHPPYEYLNTTYTSTGKRNIGAHSLGY